jgi:pilus assembly protein CpaE
LSVEKLVHLSLGADWGSYYFCKVVEKMFELCYPILCIVNVIFYEVDMPNRILSVDDNEINLKVVSTSLTNAGYEVHTAKSGPEALDSIEKTLPELVVLDVSMPDMDGYEVCRRMRKHPITAKVPIIMLTALDTVEQKIKGFEAGADDYMVKPFQPAELVARVKALLKRAAPLEPTEKPINCKVISVYSLRGGSGVSTLATNIAAGLKQIWGPSVLLMDMCFVNGQSALMLNMPLRNTWADLTAVSPEEMDEDLIRSVIMLHESGLSVLASPRKVEESELIKPEQVSRVLEICKKLFKYIVLDLPHDLYETTALGLDASEEIILLLAPELASTRMAVNALEVFDRLGYSKSKTRVVMNWIFEKHGLPQKGIENVLKMPISANVPFAAEAFISAINIGMPPVLGNPSSPLGVLFEDLAFSLSSEEDKAKPPAHRTETWQRVNKRIGTKKSQSKRDN